MTPLRAAGLETLEGREVCAVVYDGDISINYGPLNGDLKGANLGTVAFAVDSSTPRDGSSLPAMEITILDANQICESQLELLTEVPVPLSRWLPFDVGP